MSTFVARDARSEFPAKEVVKPRGLSDFIRNVPAKGLNPTTFETAGVGILFASLCIYLQLVNDESKKLMCILLVIFPEMRRDSWSRGFFVTKNSQHRQENGHVRRIFWKMSSGVKALLFRRKHRYMKLRQTQVIQNCSRDERAPSRAVNETGNCWMCKTHTL